LIETNTVVRMKRKDRRLKKWAIALVLLAAVLVALKLWVEHAVLKKSERILAELSGPGTIITIGDVRIDLLPGNIHWADLRIEHPTRDPIEALGERMEQASGRVDTVAIKGLSIWRLLFKKTFAARSVKVSHPDLALDIWRDGFQRRHYSARHWSSTLSFHGPPKPC
jgi:hypothetical protein